MLSGPTAAGGRSWAAAEEAGGEIMENFATIRRLLAHHDMTQAAHFTCLLPSAQ